MKLHIVFNKDGEILGAAQLDTAAPVRARPLADEKEGHRAAQVYVPTEYQHYDMADVCHRLRVDVKGKFPELKVKE
jgi:hypothetical protein